LQSECIVSAVRPHFTTHDIAPGAAPPQRIIDRADYRQPVWSESVCAEASQHDVIGSEPHMLSADGYLKPSKNNQAPPDLKYFNQSRK